MPDNVQVSFLFQLRFFMSFETNSSLSRLQYYNKTQLKVLIFFYITDGEKEELSSACSMLVEDDLHDTCYNILHSRALNLVTNFQDIHVRFTCTLLGQCYEDSAFQKKDCNDLVFTSEMETSNEGI